MEALADGPERSHCHPHLMMSKTWGKEVAGHSKCIGGYNTQLLMVIASSAGCIRSKML